MCFMSIKFFENEKYIYIYKCAIKKIKIILKILKNMFDIKTINHTIISSLPTLSTITSFS